MDSTPTSPATDPAALGPHAADFQQLLGAARALSPAQQAALEREYPSRGDDGTALAAAFDALTRAGRMTEQDGDPVWDALQDANDITEAAGSAAAGVLARDLVDAGVFRTLTASWRSAGLGLPGEPVPPAPRTRWGWFELGRWELAARLLFGALALVAAAVVASRLPHDQQKDFLTSAALLGAGVALLGPVVTCWRWED